MPIPRPRSWSRCRHRPRPPRRGSPRRFTGRHLVAIEESIGAINTEWVSRLPALRRGVLLRVATIDGDTTDVEVYGRTKQGAKHAYTGALNLRPCIGYWAEAGVPLAGELMGGAEEPRPNCVDILDRAIAALPAGVYQVRCRWDAGYFAAELANACLARGVEFAIGAKRTRPLVAAAKRVPDHAWVPAVGMDDSEVAVVDYLPGSWPKDAGIRCIARRTRIPVERIPTRRARKRRTIPTEQLTLALTGRLDAVFGYSFILTNLDLGDPGGDQDTHAEKLAETSGGTATAPTSSR